MLYFYTDQVIEKVDLLGKILKISDFDLQQETYESFLAYDTLNHECQKQTKKSQNPYLVSEEKCPKPKAHVITIDASKVKVGINGYINRPKTFTFYSHPTCSKPEVDHLLVIVQSSISIIGIIMASFFQEILFSFLNNKDLYDIVRFIRTPETVFFRRVDKFFSTSKCSHYYSFYDDEKCFTSNTSIRSKLINRYLQVLDSSFYIEYFGYWFSEYKSQLSIGFTTEMKNFLGCKHKIIISEYLTLLLLVILCVLFVIFHFFWYCQKNKKIGYDKKLYRLKNLIRFVYRTFMSSVLLVYFYNLFSFCALLKLVRSLIFGIGDFVILCLRGGFIVYPFFHLHLEIVNPKDPNESIQKIKKDRIKQQNNQITQRKKRQGSKNIYSFYRKTKDRLKVFMRVSFQDVEPAQTKRKDIILKYDLTCEPEQEIQKPTKSKGSIS